MTRVLVDTPTGSVTLTEAALTEIVAKAVAAVDGARLRKRRRRLGVSLEAGHARAELELSIAYGHVLPAVARDVQARVTEALESMCGLAVDAVDVSVEELERR